jgi:hypothetical protein
LNNTRLTMLSAIRSANVTIAESARTIPTASDGRATVAGLSWAVKGTEDQASRRRTSTAAATKVAASDARQRVWTRALVTNDSPALPGMYFTIGWAQLPSEASEARRLDRAASATDLTA